MNINTLYIHCHCGSHNVILGPAALVSHENLLDMQFLRPRLSSKGGISDLVLINLPGGSGAPPGLRITALLHDRSPNEGKCSSILKIPGLLVQVELTACEQWEECAKQVFGDGLHHWGCTLRVTEPSFSPKC